MEATMAAKKVSTTNTGIGNAMSLLKSLATKAGVPIPTPGPDAVTTSFNAHGTAINDHASQIDQLWARVNSIPFD